MNNRILGTLAMVCAPALLVEGLIPGGTETPLIVGTASMVFMVGSFCSHLGLWRVAATGENWWGRGVLVLQFALVVLAFLFGFIEATQVLSTENPLALVTDIAWPLSMLTMNFVGITVAVVGRLRGWQRFAVLPCGLAFPTAVITSIVTGIPFMDSGITLMFVAMTAAFWSLLGYVVRQSEPARDTTIAPVPSLA